MELMRHSNPNLTTKIYTDAGMLPIWDAVGTPPMFNDTQIDTPKLVAGGQGESAAVHTEQNSSNPLGAEDETFSPSKTASVPKSPKVKEDAPCRNRTCNPLIKSQLLCQLS